MLIDDGSVKLDHETAVCNYIKAIDKGILKILSKMGISTLQSYRGAQIFEALGLAEEVIDRCFTGTPSRIGGAGFEELAKETISRHREAYGEDVMLPAGGQYQWKKTASSTCGTRNRSRRFKSP
jgi:glutamate synthase (ferredoxin)